MGKNTNLTYHQKSWGIILNRAKDYYENNKERLRVQAKNKYGNLSEEEKNKKREYGKNRCCNMSEEEKKRLKEYQNYHEGKKSQYIIIKKWLKYTISFIVLKNFVCYYYYLIYSSISISLSLSFQPFFQIWNFFTEIVKSLIC